jgi:hypothetical protein
MREMIAGIAGLLKRFPDPVLAFFASIHTSLP